MNRKFLPALFLLAAILSLAAEAGIAQTASSYRLIGTVEFSGAAGAVLDDGSGTQTFYRLKEKLPDGSQIVKVQSGSITIKAPDGSISELYIVHDAAKGSSTAGSVVQPPKQVPVFPPPQPQQPQQSKPGVRPFGRGR